MKKKYIYPLKTLLTFIFCSIYFFASAQEISNQNKISGKVNGDHQKPIEYATIGLLNQKDSSLVKNTFTEANGTFLFNNIPSGNYLIRASAVGYKNIYSNGFIVDQTNNSVIIEELQLPSSGINLSGVSITSRKPLIEQKIDRTVMNIENNIIASGNNLLDVLEKAPGVSIDRQNDLIRLKNKAGVMIMIDGKRNYLSNTDLNNYLRNMRSEQVSSIEIITNPSSKYDAAGNSGIINIKLKKNIAYGTNGSVSATGGSAFIRDAPDDLYNGSLNLNLNHKMEKWNFFGNASTFRDADYNEINLTRRVNYNGLNSMFEQNFYKPRKSSGISGRFGADYMASEKTTIGIMVDGSKWDGKLNNDSQTFINEVQSGISSSNSLIQKSIAKTPRNNITTNFSIKQEFDKKGMELIFDADYSGFKNIRDQDFNTDFLDQTGTITSNLQQRNNTLAKINIYAAKVDFTLPLSESLKLETGLKTGYVNTDNNFSYDRLVAGQWQNDPAASNHFLYKENINAAYVNLGKEWKNWSVQAGLRAEYTNSKGNSIHDGKVVDINYLSLFPTFFLNQTVDKNNALRYSYSRRIDRPSYEQLNPFVFFLDPYTLEEGNPFLKPQFTDNFEISYTYKNSVSLSLGYSNTSNYMIALTEQNDSSRVVKVVQGNIGNYKNYSANLSFPIQVSKWWMMQNQVSGYYNKFTDHNLLGGQLNAGQFAYNFNTSSSFTLSKTWVAELNMWFNSPNVYGMDKATRPQYAVNAGIQKSFFNNQAKLKLNINDIFYTSYYRGDSKYQNINLSVQNRWASRRGTLTFSYNFGNQNVKAVSGRKTATEDLNNRARAGKN